MSYLDHNLSTYQEAYNFGRTFLLEDGQPDAGLDARILLQEACGANTSAILAEPRHPLSEEEQKLYLSYILRRKEHEPVAYILGHWDFMGLPFYVSKDVLIPNQDTETLVEEAMREVHAGMRILDLCTGSGCILLSLLQYSLDTTGVGTDLSEKALEIAGKNADALGFSDRASFLQGDLYEALENNTPGQDMNVLAAGAGARPPFDMIVSNPPYIAEKVIETLSPEVRTAEPYMALCGGEDGLDFYRRIAQGAGRYLKEGGLLMLEIGFDQGKAVPEILLENGFRHIEVLQDYNHLDRVVRAERRIS